MASIEKQTKQRMAVLQGTLDMLILRTLLYGQAHGHQIGEHISAHNQRLPADAARFSLSSPSPIGKARLGHLEVEDGSRSQS